MSPVRTCSLHGRARCDLCRRRRAARAAAARRPYSGTAAERAMRIAVLEHHGDLCPYCDEPVPDDFVLAHYPTAHADGGPFILENLRAAHKLCNLRAGRGEPPQEQAGNG